jgi:hypothetical protein
MDANLTAFSTDTLKDLLEAKLKKPQTDMLKQIVESIRNELESREKKH